MTIEVANASIEEPKGESNFVEVNPPVEPTVVREDDVEDILDFIQNKESSSGKNDQKCERIGGHNSYGYNQGVGRNFCLGSDDEMREVVKDWIIRKQAEGLDKDTLLCYYNLGIKTNNCDYIK